MSLIFSLIRPLQNSYIQCVYIYIYVASPHPTNVLSSIYNVCPLLASEWQCTNLQTPLAKEHLSPLLPECSVGTSVAIHWTSWRAVFNHLNWPEICREFMSIHAVKNQGRKEWSEFSSGPRNPQGNGPVGNQGSLNIMKRLVKHPCGQGGVSDQQCLKTLAEGLPWCTGAHLLILLELAFPGKLSPAKWDLQESDLAYGPEWAKETIQGKYPRGFISIRKIQNQTHTYSRNLQQARPLCAACSG